ncbi:hypothetical protein sos41_31390 [Alphaproteobacteria bacterium SO-S41]|nr:hypothetical protein sos41_31390 [Alphaproteobacteria bacterium SO-S41]
MATVEIRNVQPELAIAALRRRGASLPATWSWTDMWQEEHRRAFTVAKSAGFDILGDIFDAVNRAISEGRPFEDFAKDLRPLLEAKGWWGRKEVINPQTGEKQLAQLGSTRRLRTIFDTNLRVSYATGKWERFQRTKKLLPYLVYSAVNDGKTRPLHARWGGIRPPGVKRVVLPVDHPWWDTHFPPNGWHCRCTVRAVTRAQVIAMGLDPDNLQPPPIATSIWRNPRTGQRIRVPNGIDPGFGYNPGRTPLDPLVPRRQMAAPPEGLVSKPWRAAEDAPYPATGPFPPIGRPQLLPPRLIDAPMLLPNNLSADEYANAFLAPFGADLAKDAIHIDKVGMPLVVGRSLFTQVSGALKVGKFQRGPLMRLLAEAVLRPQEIWIEIDAQRRLARRYVLRFQTDELGPDDEAGLVIFAVGEQGWTGVTAFPVKSGKSAEARREYVDREVRRGFMIWRDG